jgi:hypothetical protein
VRPLQLLQNGILSARIAVVCVAKSQPSPHRNEVDLVWADGADEVHRRVRWRVIGQEGDLREEVEPLASKGFPALRAYVQAEDPNLRPCVVVVVHWAIAVPVEEHADRLVALLRRHFAVAKSHQHQAAERTARLLHHVLHGAEDDGWLIGLAQPVPFPVAWENDEAFGVEIQCRADVATFTIRW